MQLSLLATAKESSFNLVKKGLPAQNSKRWKWCHVLITDENSAINGFGTVSSKAKAMMRKDRREEAVAHDSRGREYTTLYESGTRLFKYRAVLCTYTLSIV